jgi:hypothetical protein
METHNESSTAVDHLPHKRFDRERDIAGHSLDSNKKQKIIQDAKSLNSKFATGKFE